jgi:hypothetical protein
MVGWECPTKPREASGLDPEAVHVSVLSKLSVTDVSAMPHPEYNFTVMIFLRTLFTHTTGSGVGMLPLVQSDADMRIRSSAGRLRWPEMTLTGRPGPSCKN